MTLGRRFSYELLVTFAYESTVMFTTNLRCLLEVSFWSIHLQTITWISLLYYYNFSQKINIILYEGDGMSEIFSSLRKFAMLTSQGYEHWLYLAWYLFYLIKNYFKRCYKLKDCYDNTAYHLKGLNRANPRQNEDHRHVRVC